jgi:hypothetical protein
MGLAEAAGIAALSFMTSESSLLFLMPKPEPNASAMRTAYAKPYLSFDVVDRGSCLLLQKSVEERLDERCKLIGFVLWIAEAETRLGLAASFIE